MERNLELGYTKHARDKMAALDIAENEIEFVIKNGDRFLDKQHGSSIVYADRSAYPDKDGREARQLIVVLSEKPKNNKNIVITTYYRELELKQIKNEKSRKYKKNK